MAVRAVSLDWVLKNRMHLFSWYQVHRNRCFRPLSLKWRTDLAARSLTGIGALPELPDEARYDKTNRYVDTLVIGAGLAGLDGGG